MPWISQVEEALIESKLKDISDSIDELKKENRELKLKNKQLEKDKEFLWSQLEEVGLVEPE
jgi:predicted RNase H-like nuclease (RuvC/YqgF family)